MKSMVCAARTLHRAEEGCSAFGFVKRVSLSRVSKHPLGLSQDGPKARESFCATEGRTKAPLTVRGQRRIEK